MTAGDSPSDCVVVGASFAGLACATVLARAGLRVKVLEKKSDVGAKLHTTGIIVRDAVDQIAPLFDFRGLEPLSVRAGMIPRGGFAGSCPRFRLKRLLRFGFDHFQSDLAFNLMLGTRLMRSAAGLV